MSNCDQCYWFYRLSTSRQSSSSWLPWLVAVVVGLCIIFSLSFLFVFNNPTTFHRTSNAPSPIHRHDPHHILLPNKSTTKHHSAVTSYRYILLSIERRNLSNNSEVQHHFGFLGRKRLVLYSTVWRPCLRACYRLLERYARRKETSIPVYQLPLAAELRSQSACCISGEHSPRQKREERR